MKKLVVMTIVLLNVAGLGGVAYAVSAAGSDVFMASKQTTVDPSSADQNNNTDEKVQNDQSSSSDTTVKQDSNNKKTAKGTVKDPNRYIQCMNQIAKAGGNPSICNQ